MKEIRKFINILKEKVKERQFNVIEKILISLLVSFLWVLFLAYTTPSVRYMPLSLPFFGYLYSKLFSLINS